MAEKSRLDDLKAYIQAQGWRWTPGKPMQHGEQIVVTDGQSQASVAFYFKHQSLVPGGVNSPLKAALTTWINGEAPPVEPLSASTASTGTRLDMLKQFIRERGWNWGPGAIDNGEQIVVSDAGVTALVNFWPKKGTLRVQGQDSSLKAALEAWVNGDSTTLPESTPASIAPSPARIDELNQDEVGRVVRRPTSSVQGAAGSPVLIESKTWEVKYYPGGFWRFCFADGGILDWYEESTGRFDVRGKTDAESHQIFLDKAHGKIWKGDLDDVKRRVEHYFPRFSKIGVPSVLGMGWYRRTTVLGARFDFNDGAVLNYYTGKEDKGKLLIQGRPSPLTAAALRALPNPFWAGLDTLTATLKQLFPDWRLGEPAEPAAMEEGVMSETTTWIPLDNALNWQHMKPDDRALREAIHEGAPCQKALIDDWASVLSRHQERRHLLAHAPTGLGKTLAALIPALAWVAEDPDRRRVYYLVNRVVQHDNPLRELKDDLAALFEQHTGRPLRVVDLVGRSQLCHHPQARSLPDTCRNARDNARFDLLPDGVSSWSEVKAHLGRRACPYHTLQGLMAQAHVIICDYWWLFSPEAHRGGAGIAPAPAERAGFSSTDSIVIVDEAHNLVPRVGSWVNVEGLLTEVENAVQKAAPRARQCLTPVLAGLKTAPLEKELLPSALLSRAGGAEAVQAALDELREAADSDEAASIPERLLRLLLCSDEAVVLYPEADWQTQARRVIGRLVDPAPLLQAGYGRVFASLSMSGTLSAPADGDAELRYQVPLLGLPVEATLARKYASPFPLRNQRWIYSTDTVGTAKARGKSIVRYADHIINVSQATPGVTAVFFSSYAFLEQVRNAMEPATRALTVCETRADAATPDTPTDLAGYEQRLRALVAKQKRAILLAVYSGKLAEGANFADNLIKAVICVSIPMEYPKLFHERLQAVYTRYFAGIAESLGDDPAVKAREYALDRLSLSLVLQACGRGIRHEKDRCAFVLLDRRYDEYGWRRFLMPRPYNVREPQANVEDFHHPPDAFFNLVWDAALLQATQSR